MEGVPDSARRFQGFYTYKDARDAWDSFEQHGTLPPGIPAISDKMKRIAEALRDKMRSTSKTQEAAVARLASPRSPRAGPSMHRNPPRLPTVVQFAESVRIARPPRRLRQSTPAPSSQPLPAPVQQALPAPGTDARFWIVFNGPEPGVYLDQ